MALSGSHYTNVGSHWRLQVEWTGTPNVDGNYTDIESRLYWIGLDGYSAVYSSATKTTGLRYNGGSWTTESGSFAKLSANQKRWVCTQKFRINHNSKGEASFTVGGYFDIKVDLVTAGYVDRITVPDKSYTLNTIPRESTYTGSKSWTAGSNFTLSAKRASTSFSHKVYIDVLNSAGSWVNIKRVDFWNTASSSFSTAENTEIFKALNGRSSMSMRLNFHTMNGDSSIGYTTISGTVSTTGSNTTSWGGNFNIGDTMAGTISKANSAYTSTVELIFSGTTYTLFTKSSSTDWTYNTSSIASSLYSKTASVQSISGVIRIYTYYNGIQVRTYAQSNITAYVTKSEPYFAGTALTYVDTNATAKALTGDATKIIQNASTVQVTLPVASRAMAKNGASIVNYVATLGGSQQSASYSTTANVVFNFPIINAGVDQTLTVTAVDSRGFTVDLNKAVTMIPYNPPVLNGSAKRKNGFDDDTILLVKGSMSPVMVGTTQKNSVTSVKYRYKKKTDSASVSTWATWSSYSVTNSGTTYVTNSVTKTFDNTSSWDVEMQVNDRLGSRTVAYTVTSGKPILFIDSNKKTVGVGKFPESSSNALEVEGGVQVKSSGFTQLQIKSTGSGYDPILSLESNGGTWAILNDDSDSARLDFRINNSRQMDLTQDGTLRVRGRVISDNYFETGTSLYGPNGGGLRLNNSDIVGANSIFFNDTLNGDGEGLQFPRSSATDVNETTQCDTLRGLDGHLYFNSKDVLHEGAYQIVTGYSTVKPIPDTATETWISYGKTMNGTPRIFCTPNTSVPGKTVGPWGVTAVSNTGFNLHCFRSNDTNMAFHWVAIWEK